MQLSIGCFRVRKSLNHDLAVITSWYLKWHVRLNPKETKSMVISRSRTNAPGYGDLTLDGAKLEEVKSRRILGVSLDSNLSFETYLREVVSKAARSLGAMHRPEKLFDCSRVPMSCFNAYVFVQLREL